MHQIFNQLKFYQHAIIIIITIVLMSHASKSSSKSLKLSEPLCQNEHITIAKIKNELFKVNKNFKDYVNTLNFNEKVTDFTVSEMNSIYNCEIKNFLSKNKSNYSAH